MFKQNKAQLFYFISVAVVIFFMLILIVDVIWGIGIWFFSSKMIQLPPMSGIVFLSICLTVWSLYEGTKVPPVKQVTIQSPKIKEALTIVFLSDLHLHRTLNPQKLSGIIRKVNALQADIVILGGDTIDDSSHLIQPLVHLLQKIKARQGRFFVAGNHEYYNGFQKSIQSLQRAGYTFLYNTGRQVDSVYIAGIPDATAQLSAINLEKGFENAKPDSFRILVSHTPLDRHSQNIFDLELAGHTHGGQIFPFHLLTKWYNRYLSGLYRLDNGAQLYISRGSGQWGPQMRFLASSEITVIHLQPQTKE